MKKMKVASLAIIGLLSASACASALSVPVKAAVKGCEKAAVKLGICAAEKSVVQGGAKLAAVTAERETAKSATRGTIKTIAKEAGAKKILAVGAAATMVVSGHEIADGVQTYLDEKGKGEHAMGEGVGKSAEKNPNVAIAVGRSITKNSPAAYMKYVYLAGMCVLGALVAWFLWPWVALVRNMSALAARRRSAAMQCGDVIDVTPVPASSPEPTCRSGFSRLEVFFVVAACLGLTLLGVWRMAASRDGREVPASATTAAQGADDKACARARQEERIARRKAIIANMHAAYADALERHYHNFFSDIERVGAAQFDAVRRSIPGIVEQYGTFSRCKDLFKTIVADKLKGGNETESSIRRDLEAEYYRGLYAARDKVQECLGSFVRSAESAREALKLELEAELGSVELPGDDAYKALLVECGERIEQKKSDLTWGQIDAGIALALEAACIRQTVAAVARILGKTAVRQAGTMAAGAGAAISDGPLPVGDIIGGAAVVGCTAWSAWDVYKATKVLPAKLRCTLESVTRECENQTVEEVKKAGREVLRVYSVVEKTTARLASNP